jgi:hypothetical protein
MRLRWLKWCSAVFAVCVPLAQAAAEAVSINNDDARHSRYARMNADPRSAAGAYLCARFAMSEGDATIAADGFLVALQANPTNPLIGHQALAANLLAGRPMTQLIAQQVVRAEPGYPLAQLVLAGNEVRVGHWQAAAQDYAAMSPDGIFALMQKPLLAWAQFGAGRKDAMRTLVRPDSDRNGTVGGAFLFQAGLMADIDNHPDDAERLYLSAQPDLGADDLPLARALASLQARRGDLVSALKTLDGARAPGIHLEASAARLRAAVAERTVRDPGDAIAGIYVSFALLARQRDANELSDILFRLALSLRPDQTAARLQAAAALDSEGRTRAALALLAVIPATDVLAPSAESLRAAFKQEQRQ